MIWGYPSFRKPANRPCQSWNQQGPCSTSNGRPVPFTFLGLLQCRDNEQQWMAESLQNRQRNLFQSAKPKNYGGTATKNYGGTACHRAISVGKERYIHICVCAHVLTYLYNIKNKSWMCPYMLRQYEVYVCVYCTYIYIYIYCSFYVTTCCVACINLYCAQEIFSYMLFIVLCIVSLMYIRVLPIDVYILWYIHTYIHNIT